MTDTMNPGAGSARLRNWLYGISGLGIGALFLYLTARNIDLKAAAAIIADVNLLWTVPITIAYLLNMALRCVRWHFMFPDHQRPTPRHTVEAFMIGKLGNNILPGRMGEMLRAMAIGRTVPDVGITGTLATVVVEKVLDALAIVAMLGLALTFAPLPDWAQQAGLGMVIVFPGVLLGLVLLDRNHHLFDRFDNIARGESTAGRWLGWLLALPRKFSSGLHTLRGGR
ncbi:MAG: flippase-like domain-containing protein, partial [Halioglobus sp.]|nr:flippase-like domain-containing protein [Halioglobus sp.]